MRYKNHIHILYICLDIPDKFYHKLELVSQPKFFDHLTDIIQFILCDFCRFISIWSSIIPYRESIVCTCPINYKWRFRACHCNRDLDHFPIFFCLHINLFCRSIYTNKIFSKSIPNLIFYGLLGNCAFCDKSSFLFFIFYIYYIILFLNFQMSGGKMREPG